MVLGRGQHSCHQFAYAPQRGGDSAVMAQFGDKVRTSDNGGDEGDFEGGGGVGSSEGSAHGVMHLPATAIGSSATAGALLFAAGSNF